MTAGLKMDREERAASIILSMPDERTLEQTTLNHLIVAIVSLKAQE
jgi:hypothetical protein